jgi:hypothetical protein
MTSQDRRPATIYITLPSVPGLQNRLSRSDKALVIAPAGQSWPIQMPSSRHELAITVTWAVRWPAGNRQGSRCTVSRWAWLSGAVTGAAAVTGPLVRPARTAASGTAPGILLHGVTRQPELVPAAGMGPSVGGGE